MCAHQTQYMPQTVTLQNLLYIKKEERISLKAIIAMAIQTATCYLLDVKGEKGICTKLQLGPHKSRDMCLRDKPRLLTVNNPN